MWTLERKMVKKGGGSHENKRETSRVGDFGEGREEGNERYWGT